MNYLATKNNNEAAKRAARNGTPYVPWDVAETTEPGILLRIPALDAAPRGWQQLSPVVLHLLDVCEEDTYGFAFLPADRNRGTVTVFRPLPEAHEPRSADR